MSNFSREDDKKLISYIRNHPFMHSGSKEQLSQSRRLRGWNFIANKLKKTEEECRKHWKTIKNCYYRQLKGGKLTTYNLFFLPAAREYKRKSPFPDVSSGYLSSQNQSNRTLTNAQLDNFSELIKSAVQQASKNEKSIVLNIDLNPDVNKYLMKTLSTPREILPTSNTDMINKELQGQLEFDNFLSAIKEEEVDDFQSSDEDSDAAFLSSSPITGNLFSQKQSQNDHIADTFSSQNSELMKSEMLQASIREKVRELNTQRPFFIRDSDGAFSSSSTITGNLFSQKQSQNNHIADTFSCQNSELMKSEMLQASISEKVRELNTQMQFNIRAPRETTLCTPGASIPTPSTGTKNLTLNNQSQNNNIETDNNTLLDSFFESIKSLIKVLPPSLIDQAKEEISKIAIMYHDKHYLSKTHSGQ